MLFFLFRVEPTNTSLPLHGEGRRGEAVCAEPGQTTTPVARPARPTPGMPSSTKPTEDSHGAATSQGSSRGSVRDDDQEVDTRSRPPTKGSHRDRGKDKSSSAGRRGQGFKRIALEVAYEGFTQGEGPEQGRAYRQSKHLKPRRAGTRA